MESPRSPYMRDSKCGVSHPMQTPQKNACYVGSTKNLKLSYGLTTNKTRSSKEYISAVWPTMSTRWTTPTTLLSAIFKSSPLKRSQMKLVFRRETWWQCNFGTIFKSLNVRKDIQSLMKSNIRTLY